MRVSGQIVKREGYGYKTNLKTTSDWSGYSLFGVVTRNKVKTVKKEN
jgi:hypothetical protein